MTTIVIADDHPVVRDGLAALLKTVADMTVVATAADGVDAVRVAVEHQPDVVLMDLHMPELDGIEATRQIVGRVPATKVLVLTMFEDDDSVISAIRAGASGYLLKGAGQADIVRAITAVAAGDALFSATAAKRIVDLIKAPTVVPVVAELPDLTPRERQILTSLAAGRANGAIARELDISPKTVANQLSVIFAKLGVTDRTQAAIRARQAGMGDS